MKKNLTVIVSFILFISCTFAQTAKNITVSIAGIEYDDPAFAALKDKVKMNAKAKNVTQSYSDGTAKLSLIFNGPATELWDEIPASAKQPFKLTGINATAITLQLKTGLQKNETNSTTQSIGPISNASEFSKLKDNCTECYMDLCKYDDIKTFQGQPYYGIRYDDGMAYYRCENGMLIRKTTTTTASGTSYSVDLKSSTTTDTILYANKPVGTSWGFRIPLLYNGNRMDMRTIVAKGITVEINGKTYKDVIVINRTYGEWTSPSKSSSLVHTINTFIPESAGMVNSNNVYYAKGDGIIMIQKVTAADDVLLAVQQYRRDNAGTLMPVKPPEPPMPMKGKIDPTLVGLWEKPNTPGSLAPFTYLQLNSYGTFEKRSSGSLYKGYWRVDGDKIEFVDTYDIDSSPNYYSYTLEKTKDANGKVVLLMGDLRWTISDKNIQKK